MRFLKLILSIYFDINKKNNLLILILTINIIIINDKQEIIRSVLEFKKLYLTSLMSKMLKKVSKYYFNVIFHIN